MADRPERSTGDPSPPLSPSRVMATPDTMAWLLDIDGTLAVTDDIYFAVFKKLLAPLGYEVDEDWYRQNVHGKVDKDVFSALMPSASAEQLFAMSQRKDALFCEQAAQLGTPLIPGLAEALAMAKAMGVRCIAVSNAPRAACEVVLETLRRAIPAADVIEDLVVGAECAHAKPRPDPYIDGAARLGVPCCQCLVFEDSPSGVRSGCRGCARAG